MALAAWSSTSAVVIVPRWCDCQGAQAARWQARYARWHTLVPTRLQMQNGCGMQSACHPVESMHSMRREIDVCGSLPPNQQQPSSLHTTVQNASKVGHDILATRSNNVQCCKRVTRAKRAIYVTLTVSAISCLPGKLLMLTCPYSESNNRTPVLCISHISPHHACSHVTKNRKPKTNSKFKMDAVNITRQAASHTNKP